MLARANSDAAARLRRSKSASTVHKCPISIAETIDLEVVRQQALAAATTAFARAQAKDAMEHIAKRSSDLLRTQSNASRKSLVSQGIHFPPRGSSFRSMQAPKGEQVSRSQPESQASILNIEHTTEQFPRFHPTPTNAGQIFAPHRPPIPPSVSSVEGARISVQQKVVRPSLASSVTSKEIRKARSMYYASSIQTGSPVARPPVKYLTKTPLASQSPVVEPSPMHSSIRATGQLPLTEPRLPVTVAPGVTLNDARDEYLHKFQQSSIKYKPSIFLAPFVKRKDKAMDKATEKARNNASGVYSFSVSRGNTPIDLTLDSASGDAMPRQNLKEKRSFSGSLKHRVRKVFRRTSGRNTNLPVQHIDASRKYFDAPHLSPSSVDTSSIPCPDEATLQRVHDRAPSIESTRPTCLRSEYRSDSTGSGRSVRSLHSEVNALHVPASRVTSWGTTSTSDTLMQRNIKRMTVIHESKDSVGNEGDRVASGIASRRKSLPLPPLSSFRDPMPMHSLPEEDTIPIDPKRVFSALVREIETTKSSQQPKFTVQSISAAESESSTIGLKNQARDLSSSDSHDIQTSVELSKRPLSRISAMAHRVHNKPSTIKSFERAIRSTIRAVTPVVHHSSPDPEVTKLAANAVSEHENNHRPRSTATTESEGRQGDRSTTKPQNAAPVYIPSASQIEKQMEKSKDCCKAYLKDPGHFQFPRKTDKTYDVNAFTRQACVAANEILEQSKKPESRSYSVTNQEIRKFPSSPKVPDWACLTMPMSPSIYSRNTDGISVDPNDSVVSFDGPGLLGQSHNSGSAVVLTSQSVRSYIVGTPSPQRQEAVRTSRDWKDWLVQEISSMELSSLENLTIDEKYKKSSKRGRSGSLQMSSTEEDTAVVTQDGLDAPASQIDTETLTARNSSCDVSCPSEPKHQRSDSTSMSAMVSEEQDSYLDTNAEDLNSGSSTDTVTGSQADKNPQSASFFSYTTRQLSTANGCASYNTGSNTTGNHPENGHHTLPDSIRCSGNNSLASGRPISPSNSMALLNSPKSPKSMARPVFCPSVSARSAAKTLQYVPDIPLKRHSTQVRRKENLTPNSLYAHKHSSPSSLSPMHHPSSQQRLSLSNLNHTPPNSNQLSTMEPRINTIKAIPSQAPTSLHSRVRVIARPISPEKCARRPKSSFDLQATPRVENPTTIAAFNTASPPRPRPSVGEPALYTAPSPGSLSLYKVPSPTPPAATFSNSENRRSTTPGHRIADQFLRQRNSATESEDRMPAKRREGMILVREDTPAFL